MASMTVFPMGVLMAFVDATRSSAVKVASNSRANEVISVFPEQSAPFFAAIRNGRANRQGNFTFNTDDLVKTEAIKCTKDCQHCVISIQQGIERRKAADAVKAANELKLKEQQNGSTTLVIPFAFDLAKVSKETRDVFAPPGHHCVAGPNSITLIPAGLPDYFATHPRPAPRPIGPLSSSGPRRAPGSYNISSAPSLSSSISSVSSFGSGSGPVTPPVAAHHRPTRPRPMYLRAASSNISSSSASSNFSLPTSLLASPASAFSLADNERIVVRGQKIGKGWF